ncbi:MAG TPA: lytic transglycosylase domain-containing protein [Cyclobacteriaceae bacterium]|nr:lytic transglycosylase domain-containing protein [Cyclobacteriaceae bacterium]
MQKSHLYTLYLCIVILFGCFFYLFSVHDQIPRVEFQREGTSTPNTYLKAADQPFSKVNIFELPEGLNFAGEPVPMNQPDVMERFEREIYVNAYWHSNTLLLMKRGGKFLPTIEKILAENGIPDDFKYVALIESGLMNVVSPAGARGFWQFMEGTAKERGLEVNKEVDERYHFIKATQAACKYLQNAYARFGNWTSVAASYNMGIAGLTRSKNSQKMTDFYSLLLNEETSRYIFRILAVKEIFENPGKYGFELQTSDLYTMPLMREIVVTNTIDNLADWAIRHNSNYKELKIYNPWLRSTKLTVSKGRSYQLVLPT